MRRLIPAVMIALTALAPIACGAEETDERASASDGGPGTRTSYPLRVESCGVSHTYERAPRRAVSLNQNATEILLALGLQDRMVGTAFTPLPVAKRYRAAYESVPKLADRYPAREELLAADPDFVYGSLDGAFGDDPVSGRDQLEELGIATFQATENCSSNPGAQQRELTMDVLYDDIRTLGRIFDVQDRAARLIADLRAQIRGIEAAIADVRSRVRVARLKTPETGSASTDGRAGVGNLVIELAGGRNVFGDLSERTAEVSWEEVARRDPQVILLASAVDPASKASIEFLDASPAIEDVAAVRDRRYVSIGFAEIALGVRTVDGIKTLARHLYPEQVR